MMIKSLYLQEIPVLLLLQCVRAHITNICLFGLITYTRFLIPSYFSIFIYIQGRLCALHLLINISLPKFFSTGF